MRHLAIAAILTLAACGSEGAQPPAETPEDATAGSSGVGKFPGELDHNDPSLYQDAKIERDQIIGTWSFDRTCASGDAMQIKADGTVGYDEWGSGTWAINDEGKLVLTLQRQEPGTDAPSGDAVTLTFTAADPVTDTLFGNIASETPDLGRAMNAKRCPAS